MKRSGLEVADVDLFEINEAFSVVPMVAMKEMNIPHAKMNVLGGAVALGHPIGASGARVLVTLLNALALTTPAAASPPCASAAARPWPWPSNGFKSRDAFAGTRFGRARKRVASFDRRRTVEL